MDGDLGEPLTICDNFASSQPLADKIVVPDEAEYVYLQVNVENDKYYSQ